MPRYAERTAVMPEKSRAEIERTLKRYGAAGFLMGWEGNDAVLSFKMGGRYLRLNLTLPSEDEYRWRDDGSTMPAAQRRAAHEQAIRQRWRALALIVKAKCEAVESGVVSFEDEWLSWTVLPDNSTVAEWAQEQIAEVYESGKMPRLLPGASTPTAPALPRPGAA